MGGWLRKVRGALGMGLTWGAAWLGAGLLMMVTSLILTGSTGADVPYPLGFGALGFVAGVVFAGVVGLIERSRTFQEMSIGRFAAWGAVGGGLFAGLFTGAVSLLDDPAFIQNLTVLVPVFSGAGAACAAGTLAVARRAADDPALSGSPELDALSAPGDESAPLDRRS